MYVHTSINRSCSCLAAVEDQGDLNASQQAGTPGEQQQQRRRRVPAALTRSAPMAARMLSGGDRMWRMWHAGASITATLQQRSKARRRDK